MKPSRRCHPRVSRMAVAWCLMVQVVALLHLALVPHVRCPEHGEMTHAHVGSHSAVPLRQARAVLDGVYLDARDSDGEDTHDHCDWCAERRDHRVQSTSEVASSRHELDVTACREQAVGARSIAVYRFAPKVSPPIAA